MKKILMLTVMVVVMSVALFAQNVSSEPVIIKGPMEHNGDQDSIEKFDPKLAKETVLKANIVKSLNKTCPKTNGQALGDGTKPQPRDGTGFGPKASKRMGRNRDNRIRSRKGYDKGNDKRHGKRYGKRLRDGSCEIASDCKIANANKITGDIGRLGKGRGNCKSNLKYCRRARGDGMRLGRGHGRHGHRRGHRHGQRRGQRKCLRFTIGEDYNNQPKADVSIVIK